MEKIDILLKDKIFNHKPSIKNGFTQINNKFLISQDFTIYEKMVAIIIKMHAMHKKVAFPSLQLIANEIGCSRRQVVTIVKSLENKKVFIRDSRKGKSNRYIF